MQRKLTVITKLTISLKFRHFSQEEAQVEGERIISALTNKVKVKSQSTSSSSSETSNDLNRTKKSPPVIHETCSTRLKPSVVESSASKAPTKM